MERDLRGEGMGHSDGGAAVKCSAPRHDEHREEAMSLLLGPRRKAIVQRKEGRGEGRRGAESGAWQLGNTLLACWERAWWRAEGGGWSRCDESEEVYRKSGAALQRSDEHRQNMGGM